MQLTKRNFSAFLLIITGSMALGSIYSGYINNPAIPITIENIILDLLMFLFIYSGYYSYNYLTLEKGKPVIGFVLNLFLFILTAFSFTQGYNQATQRWFSIHEVLNLILPLILSIQFFKLLLNKKIRNEIKCINYDLI